MRAKTIKKTPAKRLTDPAAGANKLISIRIPEKTIKDLQKQAGKKGGLGYQQLIKAYIVNGLAEEGADRAGNPSGISHPLRSDNQSAGTHAQKNPSKIKKESADIPRVMQEDIETLGKIFKPHLKHFAG